VVITSITATFITISLVSVLIGFIVYTYMKSGWGYYKTPGDRIQDCTIFTARVSAACSGISFVWSNVT
jgi:hypothetical protein